MIRPAEENSAATEPEENAPVNVSMAGFSGSPRSVKFYPAVITGKNFFCHMWHAFRTFTRRTTAKKYGSNA